MPDSYGSDFWRDVARCGGRAASSGPRKRADPAAKAEEDESRGRSVRSTGPVVPASCDVLILSGEGRIPCADEVIAQAGALVVAVAEPPGGRARAPRLVDGSSRAAAFWRAVPRRRRRRARLRAAGRRAARARATALATLFWLYVLLPVAVSFIAEQLRLALGADGARRARPRGRAGVGALPEDGSARVVRRSCAARSA